MANVFVTCYLPLEEHMKLERFGNRSTIIRKAIENFMDELDQYYPLYKRVIAIDGISPKVATDAIIGRPKAVKRILASLGCNYDEHTNLLVLGDKVIKETDHCKILEFAVEYAEEHSHESD